MRTRASSLIRSKKVVSSHQENRNSKVIRLLNLTGKLKDKLDSLVVIAGAFK